MGKEEPEINLIPMIDVLLVILIFLMVTTTFTRFAEIKINLPTAEAERPLERPNEVHIAVDPEGNYVLNRDNVAVPLGGELSPKSMRRAAARLERPGGRHQCRRQGDPSVGDPRHGSGTHRGLTRITFATQGPPS